LVGIKRYDIDGIDLIDIPNIKNKLIGKVNELILLSNGIKSKNGLIKLYKTKIKKIENNDDIKKLIVDSYNSFGEIIDIKNRRIRIKGTDERKYIKHYVVIDI
jgi:hypothetical protein